MLVLLLLSSLRNIKGYRRKALEMSLERFVLGDNEKHMVLRGLCANPFA